VSVDYGDLWDSPRFSKAFEETVNRALSLDLSPQAASNVLWSLVQVSEMYALKSRPAAGAHSNPESETPNSDSNANALAVAGGGPEELESSGTWHLMPETSPNSKIQGMCEELRASILPRISNEYAPRDVTAVMWSFTTLRVPLGDELSSRIERRTQDIVRGFGAHDVAMYLWSIATFREQRPGVTLPDNPEVLSALLKRSNQVWTKMTHIDVTHMFWAIVTLLRRGTGLVEELGEVLDNIETAAVNTAGSMGAVDISTVLWGMATLAVEPRPETVESLLDAGNRLSTTFNEQDTMLSLWGLARLQFGSGSEFVRRLEMRHAKKQLSDGTREGVDETIAWALAELAEAEEDGDAQQIAIS